MKTKVNLSLEPDTADALKLLAQKSHRTVSQWVTDKVWEDENLKRENKKIEKAGTEKE